MQARFRGEQHLVKGRVVIGTDLLGIGDVEPDRINVG